ncbi:acyl-CoA dehydrogenase family protein [Sporichthya sp.]|uniref:acyl-CoA dehydrogenase family protein n=1 Tax=Sporichthya sp. TaxID=65475 RepID=UPI00183208F6|nr:acyl-CoA dehydrogenase family protein [Sporichthya sp.]MBA3741367.1 acyl-CoA dehydrogenase family protein [Sporichthya sp.]
MNVLLDDTNLQFRDSARAFAQREIKPFVQDWMRDGAFPRQIFKRLGELGFLGATFPAAVGGTEAGFLNLVLAAEQVGLASPSLVTAFNMNAMTTPMALLNWGTAAQHDEYLTPMIKGDLIGSFALTEPAGGSDALGSMRTRAVRDGDDWVLNGSKVFITLAPVADVAFVFAKTDPNAGHKGVSAFLVRYDDPGVSVQRMAMAPGLGSLIPPGEISFTDVRIPADRIVGDVGDGFKIAMNALDYGRIAVATKSLATGQVIRDHCIDYAQTRRAFGQEIGHFQLIQGHIADMVTEIEAGRGLIYQAAAAHDQGVAATRLSAMAKYYMAEVTFRAANSTMEIFGGYGLTAEYPIVHLLHLAHLARTGEGAANILRIAIAEDALGFRSMDRHNIRHRAVLERS